MASAIHEERIELDEKFELDRAEVLDWRNSERLKLVRAIELRVPDIHTKIDALVDGMSTRNAISRTNFHDREIAPVVENWLQDLMSEFQQGIENSAVESERALGNDVEDRAWSWADVATIGGGAAVTLAPLAAIPLVTSVATVTTTSFFVFTTSALSFPILAVGVGGLIVAGLGSNKVRQFAFNKFKDRYRKQIKQELFHKAVGNPKKLEAPSVCRTLLAEIDMIAKKRLENLQ